MIFNFFSKTILINLTDLPGSYEPLLIGTTTWAKAKGNRSVVESYNCIEQIQRNFNRHSIQVHARKWDFIPALLNAVNRSGLAHTLQHSQYDSDHHSRKVLSWPVSNTMTADFCVAAVTEALALYGTPDIFNTDQSAQFTLAVFTRILQEAGIAISIDGAGRAIDNVFIERLWRTLKYDHIYLNPADSGTTCRDGINEYLNYYNQDRPHSSLNDQTPDEVYYRSRSNQRAA